MLFDFFLSLYFIFKKDVIMTYIKFTVNFFHAKKYISNDFTFFFFFLCLKRAGPNRLVNRYFV